VLVKGPIEAILLVTFLVCLVAGLLVLVESLWIYVRVRDLDDYRRYTARFMLRSAQLTASAAVLFCAVPLLGSTRTAAAFLPGLALALITLMDFSVVRSLRSATIESVDEEFVYLRVGARGVLERIALTAVEKVGFGGANSTSHSRFARRGAVEALVLLHEPARFFRHGFVLIAETDSPDLKAFFARVDVSEMPVRLARWARQFGLIGPIRSFIR